MHEELLNKFIELEKSYVESRNMTICIIVMLWLFMLLTVMCYNIHMTHQYQVIIENMDTSFENVRGQL